MKNNNNISKNFLIALQKYFFKYFIKPIIPILYKFNKPLPHKYKFYFITHHATGHNAMLYFLHHCGVFIKGDIEDLDAFWRYKNNYERLSTFHTYCAISFSECHFKGYHKYMRLFNAKVPALLLVRDPISILKTCINFAATPKIKYK